jgi:multidrug/hemolysin transport system ATP-binding protein
LDGRATLVAARSHGGIKLSDSILSIKNLSKSYGGVKAVDNLSFDVPSGSLFAFLGQNGAGKSTTINMIIGLAAKDGGVVEYAGGRSLDEFRGQMGVVFQNNVLDENLTVEENLLLHGSLRLGKSGLAKARYREIIEQLSLSAMTKKRFKDLSGGQKRKTEIARALFSSPKLLVLDEPTTGLDPKTRAEVWQLLEDMRKKAGMCIFLTTHYMEEAAGADKVVIIHKGKLVGEGTPAELKSKHSFDRLLITPTSEEEIISKLGAKGIGFEKKGGIIEIRMEGTAQSIGLLWELKDCVRFFEAVKGTMDDVFLNASGESLEVEQ